MSRGYTEAGLRCGLVVSFEAGNFKSDIRNRTGAIQGEACSTLCSWHGTHGQQIYMQNGMLHSCASMPSLDYCSHPGQYPATQMDVDLARDFDPVCLPAACARVGRHPALCRTPHCSGFEERAPGLLERAACLLEGPCAATAAWPACNCYRGRAQADRLGIQHVHAVNLCLVASGLLLTWSLAQ
jgi:hypothetical protein